MGVYVFLAIACMCVIVYVRIIYYERICNSLGSCSRLESCFRLGSPPALDRLQLGIVFPLGIASLRPPHAQIWILAPLMLGRPCPVKARLSCVFTCLDICISGCCE